MNNIKEDSIDKEIKIYLLYYKFIDFKIFPDSVQLHLNLNHPSFKPL